MGGGENKKSAGHRAQGTGHRAQCMQDRKTMYYVL